MSSTTCSGCGELSNDLDRSTRTYSCGACAPAIERELNAAINLARWQPKESCAEMLAAHAHAALLTTT
ncbi:MAG: zinc ribbon domain-containing protein [Acidimicrobiales bacterium]